MSDTTSGGGDAGQGSNNDGDGQQGGDGKDTGTSSSSGSGSVDDSASQQGKSETTFTQADLDRILKDRLGRAKQQFDTELATARDNATKPLQEQLNEMRKDNAKRDTRDLERNGKLALSAVKTLLAENGIKADDVKDVLGKVDPGVLLKDGEPDEAEIAKFARGLARVAGRAAPDLDQGQAGAGKPQTMGDFMRDMARNRK